MMKFRRKWGTYIAETEFRTKIEGVSKDCNNIKGANTNNLQAKLKTGREKNCDVCEKQLSCGFTLSRLMRMHTGDGDQPYLCSRCDQ